MNHEIIIFSQNKDVPRLEKKHVITVLKDICRSRVVKASMSSSSTIIFLSISFKVQVSK